MQEVLDDAKRTFRQLLAAGDKHAMIDLLVSLRAETELSVDDTGWALWNICDNYALLRDPQNQYRYQLEFYEWSKTNLYPLRVHWVVTDGTQALDLISGGFLDFWWNCYQFANAEAPRVAENRAVRFESHRANAAAYTYFREFSRAESALTAIETLLAEDPAWGNHDFATVTFRTLLVEFYAASGQSKRLGDVTAALDQELEKWLRLTDNAIAATAEPEYLLGTWKQLNALRPPSAVFIGIHNAACAFAKAQQFPLAERLFRVLQERSRRFTSYSEALFLLSCWENRHDSDEIVEWLNTSKTVTLDDLKKFASVLVEVVQGKGTDVA